MHDEDAFRFENQTTNSETAPDDRPVDVQPGADDVLTARDVARLLRVNIKTVYEQARLGTIPCVQLGRSFRFSRRAIVARLGECKSASRRTG